LQKQPKSAAGNKSVAAQRANRRVQRLTNSVRAQSTAAKLDKSKPIGFMGKFLEGRSAIVTGSTSGIGLGVAKVLAAHGCNITLNGFGKIEEINAIQKEMTQQFGVKVRYSPADMTKPDQIREMVTSAQNEFGSLDILINNAGIQHIASVEDFPEEKWDQVIAINLNSAFHASKAAIPMMKKNGFGRIINIASVHGLVASVNKPAYVASKHAIIGLTKANALELAGTGVTVNAICPGWVFTPLVAAQVQLRAEKNNQTFEQAKTSLLSEKQPSGEFVTVEDLGNMAAFLSSPYASQMTGVANVMDGGWTSC